MKLQVKEWGTSKAIRLPKEILSTLGMEVGDFLELSRLDTKHKKIVFSVQKNTTPIPRKKRLTLDERLANSMNEFPILEDWDLVQPVGKELI